LLSKSCGFNELLIGGFLITAEVKTTPTKERKQTMTTETPENINSQSFKYSEIKEHFDDFIKNEGQDWVEEHKEDLHHEIFNTDYYIIGRHKAKLWLEDEVFNAIDIIKKYENFHFGSVNTDLSEPEKVVNMYVYIVGEEIVNKYLEEKEGQ